MSCSFLSLYHALPYSLRCLAASVRGLQLRASRYGQETDRLADEALERETWSKDQWSTWQAERLDHILRRAVTKVPFYRDYWEKQKTESGKHKTQPDGTEAGWEKLQNWPVLKKAVLRSRPESFVAEDCDRRRMICEHTSGTTGTPLTLWQSRETVRQWYALFEARWRRWYGLSRHDRWAILGGQLVTPFTQKQPPFWVWNAAGHQLYLSTYHITPRNTVAYVEALKKHRVTYLWTYSSAAHALAQFALDQNLHPPELKAVITNAEPLYLHQRQTIAKAFQCQVFETYGMSEMVCAASECLHGRLHLWPEVGIAEVFDPGADVPVAVGAPGRLIATGLHNLDMPLIRYEIGDTVVLANAREPCPCGRTLPILKSVEGRNDDVIVTPDGRRIGRLDPVFKSDLPISEAQIVQETVGCLRVLLVPGQGFRPEHSRIVKERLQERVGNMEVFVEERKSLPRSANGKLRAVVSLLGSPQETALSAPAPSEGVSR